MSQQAVAEFVQKVEKDSVLRGQLTQLALDDMAGIARVAASSGFNFTADEYLAYWQTQSRGNGATGSSEVLSEDELNAVAGGQKPVGTLTCCLEGTKRHDFGY